MIIDTFSAEHETHAYLKRFKKSWVRRFKPTKMEEIFEGVDLANYLVALNRSEEAIELLTFITEQITFTGNYNIWSAAGSAIILLARLLRLSESEKYEEAINRIAEHDFYAENRKKEYYESTISKYAEVIENVNSETQKWACHIMSRYLMSLNYQLETALHSFKDTENFDRDMLERNIKGCYHILKEELK